MIFHSFLKVGHFLEDSYFLGTKSLERLEHQTIQEDPFQAPFSLRQQRALKKNGSVEVEGKVCI